MAKWNTRRYAQQELTEPLLPTEEAQADSIDIPRFSHPFRSYINDETGEAIPSLQGWLDQLIAQPSEQQEATKAQFGTYIDNPQKRHQLDEGIEEYGRLAQSESPVTEQVQKEDTVERLYQLLVEQNLAEDLSPEEIKEQIEEEAPETMKYPQVVDEIHRKEKPQMTKSFNFKKFTKEARRMSEPYILNGPDEKRWCPKIRNVISDYVCRWHCLDGLALDDYRIICAETIYRQNVIDKYSREYRDADGNWVGGYLNKRFEIQYDTAGNSYQLKPGQRRRPISPDEWSMEKRLSVMREKLADEREYAGGAPEPDKVRVGQGEKTPKTAAKVIQGIRALLLNPENSAARKIVKEAQAQSYTDVATWRDFFDQYGPAGVDPDEVSDEVLEESGYGKDAFLASDVAQITPEELKTAQELAKPVVEPIEEPTPELEPELAPVEEPLATDEGLSLESTPGTAEELEGLEMAAMSDGYFYKDGLWRSVHNGKVAYHKSEKAALKAYAQTLHQDLEEEAQDAGVKPKGHPEQEEIEAEWENHMPDEHIQAYEDAPKPKSQKASVYNRRKK